MSLTSRLRVALVALLLVVPFGWLQAPVAGASSDPLMSVSQVASGDYHTCALLTNGTVRCWGDRSDGELGQANTEEECADVRPCSTIPLVAEQIDVLSNVVEITAGGEATCGLRSDATVWCWGAVSALGAGPSVGGPGPVEVRDPSGLVALTGVARIFAGGGDTCAVMVDGTARCWGARIGTTFGNNSTLPVEMTNSDGTPITHVVEMEINASQQICALLDGGTAECTGFNADGQLGIGTTVANGTMTTVLDPTGTGPLTGITDLTIGNDQDFGGGFTCARLNDGTADCWGINDFGQLGVGTTTGPQLCPPAGQFAVGCSLLPVPVENPAGTGPLTGVAEIQAGFDYACARLDDGTMVCWGASGHGALGDGTTTNRSLPVVVQNGTDTGNLENVVGIAVGSYQTCAVFTDTSAACWGLNLYGELGDGTITNSPLPVVVGSGDIPVTPAPDPPMAVTATAGFEQETVSWTPPVNDNGATIIGYFVTASPGGQTTLPSAGQTSATVTELTAGIAYTFTVRTISETGGDSIESTASSPVMAIGPPQPPTDLVAIPGGTSASISWTAPANPGSSPITGYVVTPWVNGTTLAPQEFDTPATSQTITGLAAGEPFSYTVAAINAEGTSQISTLPSEIIIGLPTAPRAAIAVPGAATATTGSLVVSFVAGAADGAPVSDFMATCTSSNGGLPRTGTRQGPFAGPIAVTGVTTKKSYACTVAALNEGGAGPSSSPSAAVVAGAPRAPAKPTVSQTVPGALAVAFVAPANNGSPIASYVAGCVSSNGGAAKTKVGTASPITVAGLTSAKTYTCAVRATNARGTSSASPSSNAVIVGVPAAPTRPAVVHVAAGSLQLTFTAPANNGAPITSYSAACTSSNGGIAKTRTGTTSPIIVTGLTTGKTYTCTITASNSRGKGPPSASSTAVKA